MEDFSTLDKLRALTCGCLPTCRLAPSSSSEDLLNQTTTTITTTTTTNPPPSQRAWYEQSILANNDTRVPGDWEERNSRREADLLSLHDAGETVRRVRPRRGNGDISGGGGGSSGLSRWTLLKSWWSGGAIRLEDSDEEVEDATRNDQEEEFAIGDNTIVLPAGEEDAVSLDINSRFTLPPSTTFSSSPSQSEAPTDTIDEEERIERKVRRKIRRAARALGMSIEEYEDLMRIQASKDDRRRSKANSQTSSTTSQELSHKSLNEPSTRQFDEQYYAADESLDGGEELFSRQRGSRRSSRRQEASRDSYSADGSQSTSDHRGSSNGSQSGRSPTRRRSSRTDQLQLQAQHFLSPADYAAPPSSSSSSAYATSSGDGPSRSRHHHHPSVSSTSTSSSGLKKSRQQISPLENQREFSPQHSSSYYQDQFGQLQSKVPGYNAQHSLEEAGQYFIEDATGLQYFVPNSQLLAYQQQQQDQNNPYFPSTSTTYHDASTEPDYSHIHPTPLLSLPPSITIAPSATIEQEEDEDSSHSLDIKEDTTSHLAPTTSKLPIDADPLEFLRALKGTKVVTPTPEVIPAILVDSVNVSTKSKNEEEEETEESILGVWGKIQAKAADFIDEVGDSSRWTRDLSEEEEEEEEDVDEHTDE